MTTEELDRLIGLEAAATKGPWRVPVANLFRVIACDGEIPVRGIVEHPEEHFYFGQDDLSYPDGDNHAAADRALIAALRNAASDLIAMARWAEKAKQATAVATEHCLACYGPGGRIANGLDTSIGCSHCKPLREALAAYPTTTSPARAKE